MKDYMDRRVTPLTWGPQPPCKQTLTRTLLEQAVSIKAHLMTKERKYQRVGIDIRLNKDVRYDTVDCIAVWTLPFSI